LPSLVTPTQYKDGIVYLHYCSQFFTNVQIQKKPAYCELYNLVFREIYRYKKTSLLA